MEAIAHVFTHTHIPYPEQDTIFNPLAMITVRLQVALPARPDRGLLGLRLFNFNHRCGCYQLLLFSEAQWIRIELAPL